jgi:hypothetical protein
LELNGTYQLLVNADDDNTLGKELITLKKNKEALSEFCRLGWCTGKHIGNEVYGYDLSPKCRTKS